jgi:putative DNA primase/helicase
MGEQVFVYNYGLGANGKSTFMEAIARLMGPYAQVLPAEAITGDMQRRGDQATPEFARLPGARLVRCAELPRGQGFRENTLKLLTGGEPILVRHLHARFFELHPTFKAIGSGNDRPPIGGVDEGIWRRIKLVPWEVTIAPKDRRPMAKVLAAFAAEGAGVLNWLLEGVVSYLEDGLWVPPEIQSATESYRADMDPVGEFCSSCVVGSPDDSVTARDMYHAYVAWAHANSVKPFAERTFAQIMMQKGYQKSMGRIRVYQAVRLQGVPDDPDRAPESSNPRYPY